MPLVLALAISPVAGGRLKSFFNGALAPGYVLEMTRSDTDSLTLSLTLGPDGTDQQTSTIVVSSLTTGTTALVADETISTASGSTAIDFSTAADATLVLGDTAFITITSPSGVVVIPVTIDVNIVPVITDQPDDSTVDEGDPATATVGADGLGLSYQWYIGASGTTTTPISGATSATLNYTPEETEDVWCRVTNSLGSDDSTAATITVNALSPAITDQPDNDTIDVDATATLSLTATGANPKTYQWYSGESGDTGTPISGATSASYETPALAEGEYDYWCRVTNAYGTADSNTATITAETANVKYVATGGSDGAAGTELAPFATVQHAVDVIASGGTVRLNGGDTFAEAVEIIAPVTLESYGTGQAIIAPASGHGIYIENTDDVVISNLTILGTQEAPLSSSSGNYLNLLPAGVFVLNSESGSAKSTGIIIEDCEISKFVGGIYVRGDTGTTNGTDGLIIRRNHIHDVEQNGIMTWGVDALPVVRHTNPIIQDNDIHDCTGNGVQTGAIPIAPGMTSGALIEGNICYDSGYLSTNGGGGAGGIVVVFSTGATVRRNVCYNIWATSSGTDGIGIDLDFEVENSVVEYNLTFGNQRSGYYMFEAGAGNIYRFNISINDGDGGFVSSGTASATLYNNTFIGYGTQALCSLAGQPARVVNNVFMSLGSGASLLQYIGHGSDVVQGNCYYAAGSFVIYNGSSYSSLADFRSGSGQENYGGTPRGVQADPLLRFRADSVIPADISTMLQWRPFSGSPLLGAGVNVATVLGVAAPTVDFSGAALGSPYAIGAFDTTTATTSGQLGDLKGLVSMLLPENTTATDGASVPVLYDLSGMRGHARQSDATKQPTYQTNEINSLPVLRGDGSNDWMVIKDFGLGIRGDITVVAVVKPNVSSGGIVLGRWTGSTGELQWLLNVSNTDAVFARYSGSYKIATTTTDISGFQIVAGRGTASNGAEIYYADNLEASDAGSITAQATRTFTGLFAYPDGSGNFNGDLAAVLVFQGNPDLPTIVAALESHFGL